MLRPIPGVLFILPALFLAGCTAPERYVQPVAAVVGDRLVVLAHVFGEDDPWVVFTRADEEAWVRGKRYRGRVVALLPRRDIAGTPRPDTIPVAGREEPVPLPPEAPGVTLVYADGAVFSADARVRQLQPMLRPRRGYELLAAAAVGDELVAVKRINGGLQLLRLDRDAANASLSFRPRSRTDEEDAPPPEPPEPWVAYGPPRKVIGEPQTVRLGQINGAPVLCYRTALGARPQPGLKLVALKEDAWTTLPAPEPAGRGAYALGTVAGETTLARALRGGSVATPSRLRVQRFVEGRWHEPLAVAEGAESLAVLGLAVADGDAAGYIVLADGDSVGLLRFDTSHGVRALSGPVPPGNDGWLWLAGLLAILLAGSLLLTRHALSRRVTRRPELRKALASRAIGGLAAPIDRALAFLVDMLLVMPVPLILLSETVLNRINDLSYLEDLRFFFTALTAMTIYATVAECVWGQTVGKRLLRIRVRAAAGGSPGRRQIVLRNLYRYIDFFPVPLGGLVLHYLVALVFVVLTPKRQRLGDLMAATVVLSHTPLPERTFVLASASPRRRDLFAALGYDFAVQAPRIEEEMLAGETPEKAVLRLAERKALTVARELDAGQIVIAADTVVVAGGTALGKPADREDAARMLSRLSGRTHEVYTGVAVVDSATRQNLLALERTEVDFHALTPETIESYLDSGEADDKAGAYAIQGAGGRFVADVRGSLSNVIGLPMERLRAMLGHLDG